MGPACVSCGVRLGDGQPTQYGLCRACFARLEDELADAAGRVGRPLPAQSGTHTS